MTRWMQLCNLHLLHRTICVALCEFASIRVFAVTLHVIMEHDFAFCLNPPMKLSSAEPSEQELYTFPWQYMLIVKTGNNKDRKEKLFDFQLSLKTSSWSCVLWSAAVPGAPPRKVEVEALNSTALRVTWKPPLSVKQHGQIRGYQLVYSRLEKGEPHGQPVIMDVSLPEAQVLLHSFPLTLWTGHFCLSNWIHVPLTPSSSSDLHHTIWQEKLSFWVNADWGRIKEKTVTFFV